MDELGRRYARRNTDVNRMNGPRTLVYKPLLRAAYSFERA